MKFKTKVSLFLLAMFLNCTANAASDDDEANINADQNQIQSKVDSNNNTIKRKKFKTNKNLVRAQNKATKRTKNEFYDESNDSVKTKNCDIYYDQSEDDVQDPQEIDEICNLLNNTYLGNVYADFGTGDMTGSLAENNFKTSLN
jgi:hypothetical protein